MKAYLMPSALAIVCAALASCSHDDSAQSAPSTAREATTPAATAATTEGAATSTARFPGGLTIRITKVQKVAADRCYNSDTQDGSPQQGTTCLLVQATATNTGAAPIAITGENGGTPELQLLAGADQYEVDSATFAGDPGNPEVPRRLTPKSSCVFGSTFAVQNPQLSSLAVAVSVPINDTDDYTFTGVEDLLN